MKLICTIIFLFVGQALSAKQWLIIYAEKESDDAPVGHGFVSFVKEDIFEKQTKLVGCWGFYPRIKVLNTAIGSVPGELRDDWKTHRDYSFLIEVSLDEFNECLRIKDRYINTYEYNLFVRSCINFVKDIAKALKKVKQPNALYRFPAEVVIDLISKNQDLQEAAELSFGNSIGNITHELITKAPIPEQQSSAKILSKDVTTSVDKNFKWYKWGETPLYINALAQVIKPYEDRNLLDEIKDYLSNGCQVEVAVTDLNSDGFAGLCIAARGSYCCGSKGCTFRLFENGGLLTVDLGIDEEVTPSKDGVIASTGRFFPLKPSGTSWVSEEQIKTLFAYEGKKFEMKSKSTGLRVDPSGGSTPEELGKILLKAIITKDKNLWASCFLPKESWKPDFFELYNGKTRYEGLKELYEQQIDYLRGKFEEEGFTDYSKVKFSRVTFRRNTESGYNPVSETESTINSFYIEFSYGVNFIGRIGSIRLATYKKGKYFVASQGGQLEAARR